MQYDDDLEEIFNEYQKSARKISKTYSKMEKSVAHSQQCKEQCIGCQEKGGLRGQKSPLRGQVI